MAEPFRTHRSAALALLNNTAGLARRSGQSLGQLAVDDTPLSDRQAKWPSELLAKAGLPPMAEGKRP